jgi:DNA-binding MarR family transcriptional regulator
MNIRTTIEITEEQRAKLVELAARRRIKGFSTLVQEALENYFSTQLPAQEQKDLIRTLRGSLSEKESEQLRQQASRLREDWR